MGFSCAQKLLLCMRCAKHLLYRAPAVVQERDVWEDFNYSPWQPTLITIIPHNKLHRSFSHIHKNTSRKDICAVDILLGAQHRAAESQHEAPYKVVLPHPRQLLGLTVRARSGRVLIMSIPKLTALPMLSHLQQLKQAHLVVR